MQPGWIQEAPKESGFQGPQCPQGGDLVGGSEWDHGRTRAVVTEGIAEMEIQQGNEVQGVAEHPGERCR